VKSYLSSNHAPIIFILYFSSVLYFNMSMRHELYIYIMYIWIPWLKNAWSYLWFAFVYSLPSCTIVLAREFVSCYDIMYSPSRIILCARFFFFSCTFLCWSSCTILWAPAFCSCFFFQYSSFSSAVLCSCLFISFPDFPCFSYFYSSL
jgi:hypothetical protein